MMHHHICASYECPSYRRRTLKIASKLIGAMQAIEYCSCGECIYFGTTINATRCVACHKLRDGKDKFYYFPLEQRIQVLFKSATEAKLVHDRPNDPDDDPDILRDVWDGAAWREVFRPLLGDDKRNLALQFVTDGVRKSRKSAAEVWAGSVSCLNFPRWWRNRPSHLWLTFLVPGSAVKGGQMKFFLGMMIHRNFPIV
jgi:hypothetical protein